MLVFTSTSGIDHRDEVRHGDQHARALWTREQRVAVEPRVGERRAAGRTWRVGRRLPDLEIGDER
jgi:hypothetical protein